MDDNANQHRSWSSRLAHRVKSLGPRGRSRNREGAERARLESRKSDDAGAPATPEPRDHGEVNELGERHAYQTGILGDVDVHPVDLTDMLHSLGATNFDADAANGASRRRVDENDPAVIALRRRLMAQLASLPDEVWLLIASHLDQADMASLAMACSMTYAKFGRDAFASLRLAGNKQEQLRFLNKLDVNLPLHLLCFHCGIYHARIQPGHERLTPDFVNHPVFHCPAVRDTVLPRTRLAHGRELPYAYVQLAVRAARFGPGYGVGVDALGRRWRDPATGWSHQTRYLIHRGGRLMLRVRSQVGVRPGLTPSEMRMLLFERDDYVPYFSVCAHWRDGELMRLCKCALSHVPEPPPSTAKRIKGAPGAALRVPPSRVQPGASSSSWAAARQCGFCMPGRRCPECPSEYVAKIIRAEDRHDAVERFKFMLVVIRWCDLGDGSGPLASREWAAINGLTDGYPSLDELRSRALMGTFEGAVTGVPPANRVLNLNPKNEKKGEAGNDWY